MSTDKENSSKPEEEQKGKKINENYDYVKKALTQNNRKQVPYIEKDNGDIKFKEKNFEEAMRHYSKAVMGIKILLDDKVLQTEEEVGTYVKDIGVRMT